MLNSSKKNKKIIIIIIHNKENLIENEKDFHQVTSIDIKQQFYMLMQYYRCEVIKFSFGLCST